jgi:tyrosyl-DNA phosphodiesterase 2
MDWYERARTSALSRIHGTPLPRGDTQARVVFQSWHYFDPDGHQWTPARATSTDDDGILSRDNDAPPLLTLLTWNIDATSARAEERVSELVAYATTQLHPEVDIIFFQEVSRPALQQILKDDRIRGSWFSSECDDRAWGNQSFATMTLLSRKRFASVDSQTTPCSARLGPIWRVSYPSRFGRDALCCDIFTLSPNNSSTRLTRTRLINIHLDSLPINPSCRPQQVSIISTFLRSADHGLAAGDFNPVLEEDATLLEKNGLTDAWEAVYPEQPGYTWGTDGEQPFPPNRLDKVALLGLRPHEIKIVEAKRLSSLEGEVTDLENNPPWSDHHALLCSFAPTAE